MRKFILAGALALVLSGCGATASLFGVTATPGETDGQLFCQVVDTAGASQVVGVINASVPGAVLVTGIAAAVVQDECQQAAKSAGAVSGVPVSPPATTVASVAIVPPAQTPAAPSAAPAPAS